MESEKLLEQLFDKKILVIIRYFIKNPNQNFYLREISKATRIPVSSTFRIINRLVEIKLLQIHKFKAFKLYSWNDNEQAKYIQYILEQKKTVLDSFVERASQIEGIQLIILHGEATKSQASLLIIGKNIDDSMLKELVGKAKEENDFTINYLNLQPEQFNQMAAMGLYPKKKTILFEKTVAQ